MDNWKHIGIAGDQDNIFLSATMTGNLQLIRLEHIGYFAITPNVSNGKQFCVINIL